MVSPLLPTNVKSTDHISPHSLNDRLMQLIVKGTLYEGCVDYCQAQAISEQKGNVVLVKPVRWCSGMWRHSLA